MKAEHNKQRRIPTLGFVFTNAASMMRFMQPEAKHQALHEHFRRDSFGLDFLKGVIPESVLDTVVRAICTVDIAGHASDNFVRHTRHVRIDAMD